MASILNVDKIRRATGTTDAITIDTNDRPSLNDPILFWGEVANTSPFAPTSGDFINFNASIDTASGWDSTNKYYVIPKAGYYEVHCMLLSNAMGSPIAVDFYINKNGQNNFLTGVTTLYKPHHIPLLLGWLYMNLRLTTKSRYKLEPHKRFGRRLTIVLLPMLVFYQ